MSAPTIHGDASHGVRVLLIDIPRQGLRRGDRIVHREGDDSALITRTITQEDVERLEEKGLLHDVRSGPLAASALGHPTRVPYLRVIDGGTREGTRRTLR